MPNHLTPEALTSLAMRRMANTGETLEEAKASVLKLTQRLNRGELTLQVYRKPAKNKRFAT